MTPGGQSRSPIVAAEIAKSLLPMFAGAPEEAELVVLVCINADGSAGETEFMGQPRGDKTDIPLELLFGFPESMDAWGLLVASKSSGPIGYLHERDIRFTEALREHGTRIGIPLVEHVIIERDEYRLMSESMGWKQTA